MLPNNNKIESEIGDENGQLRTYYFYNISSETKLKEIATARLNKEKFTGYRGNFETFGEPYMRPGDIAKLESTKLPERNGLYLIDSVTRIFGVYQGYKQTFELGAKVG